MNNHIKPFCDTCKIYGDIHQIQRKKTGEVFFMCYECGALWNSDGSFLPLTIEVYVKKNNIKEKFKEAFEELD